RVIATAAAIVVAAGSVPSAGGPRSAGAPLAVESACRLPNATNDALAAWIDTPATMRSLVRWWMPRATAAAAATAPCGVVGVGAAGTEPVPPPAGAAPSAQPLALAICDAGSAASRATNPCAAPAAPVSDEVA